MGKTIARGLIATTAILALGMGPRQSHEEYTDEQIRRMIEHDLAEKGIDNVVVEVVDGVVTLRGQVRSVWEKERAVEIALGIHDVEEVVSELTIARPKSDEELLARIENKILRYVFYTIFDEIGVRVQDGVVTLTGRVTAPYKAEEIARFVAREPGVQEVRNEIKVLPPSPYDDELRRRLATAIYRELPEYASGSQPPIHIIVENGRVTLQGVVRSELERRRIEHIARSTFGVFSVDNRLRVAR